MLAFANLELRPATLNHYLMAVGTIGSAAALNRGRRADGVLAGTVTLSLAAAGGGLTVAIGCLCHRRRASVRPCDDGLRS